MRLKSSHLIFCGDNGISCIAIDFRVLQVKGERMVLTDYLERGGYLVTQEYLVSEDHLEWMDSWETW